jgi:hypothetical protein
VEPSSDAGQIALIGWAHPAPFRFNAVVADFIHNLRASLDQLAWQLCGCPARARVAFPVRQSRPTTALDHVHLMTPAAAVLVESVQPYIGLGREDYLWLLHQLWNQDKHRFTPLVSVLVWTHWARPVAVKSRPLPDHGDLVESVRRGSMASHLQLEEMDPFVRTLAFSALWANQHWNLIATAEAMLTRVRDQVVPLFDRPDCFP